MNILNKRWSLFFVSLLVSLSVPAAAGFQRGNHVMTVMGGGIGGFGSYNHIAKIGPNWIWGAAFKYWDAYTEDLKALGLQAQLSYRIGQPRPSLRDDYFE